MKIEKITPSSTAYTFDTIENFLTSVFVIEKRSRIYILDTFCGPESMEVIACSIGEVLIKKELIIINTHFHWDHVWGNCFFKDKTIISHELCRKLMNENWELQINENRKYTMGKVEKYLPNVTFKEKLVFHNDGIELFYSPGHTDDSISVFDHEEKVLYAGDNLERPLIYIESENIEGYIRTLEEYIRYNPKRIMASHTLELAKDDIIGTTDYLKALKSGHSISLETDKKNEIHQQNLRFIKK